ncbi:MAG: hypothetical protein MI866_14035 [Bacteroidales bacterium]|nr:hypothetical protein [Bacteroidales bacterium]
MAIKFKVQQRANPQNKAEKKFYVQPLRVGNIKRSKLEKDIIELTSLSKDDVRSVLLTLSDLIGKYINLGYSVTIEDVGTLSLRTKSEGSEKAEEVTAANVNSICVGFRPAVSLRESVDRISFVKE